MKKVGPSGTIRALSAHFKAFAFTRHEHDHFVVGLVGAGLQTFELGAETYVTPPGYLMLINPGEPHTGRGLPRAGSTAWRFIPNGRSSAGSRRNRICVPAVRAKAREELELVGFVLRGPRSAVDRVVKGLKLHG